MRYRSTIALLVGLAAFIFVPSAFAAGGCPESADRLEGFAGCIAQSRGGAVLRSGSYMQAHLDSDHKALIAAMERNSGLPPQVVPGMQGILTTSYYPFYYYPGYYPASGAAARVYYYYSSPLFWNHVTVQYQW